MMSFVGYKYARETGLDLSPSSDGFEPVGGEEDDESSISPYSDAISMDSESPSALYFQ